MNTTVVARFSGGLGNQLFQFGAAYGLAQRLGAQLLFDSVSGFRRDHRYRRHFRLLSLGMVAPEAPRWLTLAALIGARASIQQVPLPGSHIRIVHDHQSASDLLSLDAQDADVFFLDGYWQDLAYLEPVAVDLRRLLSGTQPHRDSVTALLAEDCDSVGVHVRRFDGEPNAEGINLKRDYYAAAIDLLNRRLGRYSALVFADDISSAREILDGLLPGARYISHEGDSSDVRDFLLMRQCRHMVIANSTFSWWAAWSGNSRDGLCIYPKGRSEAKVWGNLRDSLILSHWEGI